MPAQWEGVLEVECDWHRVRLGVEEAKRSVRDGKSWLITDVHCEYEHGANEMSNIAT